MGDVISLSSRRPDPMLQILEQAAATALAAQGAWMAYLGAMGRIHLTMWGMNRG